MEMEVEMEKEMDKEERSGDGGQQSEVLSPLHLEFIDFSI